MINFACISPHPPILLPNVGSVNDRNQLVPTIKSLEFLGNKLVENRPDMIVVSSPHADWGINVPLFFLAKNISAKIETFITQEESAKDHFAAGKDYYFAELRNFKNRTALIASGDLSHVLKSDGPYGLHPDGAKFDAELMSCLKNKDLASIFNLDIKYPNAGECGLRSFCFVLGILEAARLKWAPEILSYEMPFGVGYLVADLLSKR